MRIVLDTGVIVAAMRSPKGASARLLTLVRQGSCTLLASVALALEYEAVCKRKEHRQAAGLSLREAEQFTDALIAMAEPVNCYFAWRPQAPDPGDEMVLEAAINGRAAILTTFNTKDFRIAPSFGIEVLLPRDALRRLLL